MIPGQQKQKSSQLSSSLHTFHSLVTYTIVCIVVSAVVAIGFRLAHIDQQIALGVLVVPIISSALCAGMNESLRSYRGLWFGYIICPIVMIGVLNEAARFIKTEPRAVVQPTYVSQAISNASLILKLTARKKAP